jgi:peptidyl-tRNA hydrolase, PTH1 family
VVVGLGNPGEKYAQTRHNVGFRCVDAVSERCGIRLNDRRQHADVGQGSIGGIQVVLAKPRTFMNNSGLAARYLIDRFGIKPDHLLIVMDDMDLPVGTVRLRGSGGSGGHNGLNSINMEIKTQEYPRVRIGIGRPAVGALEHVLSGFTPSEEVTMRATLPRAAEVVEACVEHGVEYAMNRYN